MSFSKYPNTLDDNSSIPVVTDLVTPVRGEVVNRLRDAVFSIERELGTQPSSTFSTVKDRLDAIDSAINAISGGESFNEIIDSIEELNVLVTTLQNDFSNLEIELAGFDDLVTQVNNLVVDPSTANAIVRFSDTSGSFKNSSNGPYVLDSGRLGVGTNSPSSSLEVVGTTTIDDLEASQHANLGTYLSIGANASGAGTIRLANGFSIQSKDNGDVNDLNIISLDASDILNVGDVLVSTQNYNIASGGSYNWQINSSNIITSTSSLNTFSNPIGITNGGNLPGSGDIRLKNNATIVFRDNASGQIVGLQASASNNLIFGSTVNSGGLYLDTGSGQSVNLRPNGAAQTYSFEGTRFTSPMPIRVNTSAGTVASTGELRFRNNSTIISARNQGNNNDASIISFNNLDQVIIGDSSIVSDVTINVSAGGSFSINSGGNEIIEGISTLVSNYTPIEINTNSGSVSDTGDIRLRSGFSLSARNVSDDGNITILSTDNDILYLGGLSEPDNIYISADDSIFLRTGSFIRTSLSVSYFRNHTNVYDFDSTVSNPLINQDSITTSSATGQTLTLHAQNSTGTNSTGGDLVLRPGSGTLLNGSVYLEDGNGNVQLSIDDFGVDVVGNLTFSTGNIILEDGYIAFGNDFPESGKIRLSNSDTIVWEGIGGTDLQGISFENDELVIGDLSGESTTIYGTSVELIIDGSTGLNASSSLFNIYNPVALNSSAGTVSDTGDLRVRNQFIFSGRNNLDNNNISIMHLTNGNSVVFGGLFGGLRPNTILFDAGSSFEMMTSGTHKFIVDAGNIRSRVNTIRWDNTVTSPVLNHQTITTNNFSGGTFNIHAQNCTGTDSTGGDLVLRPGAGTFLNGTLSLNDGYDNEQLIISDDIVDIVNQLNLSTGYISFGSDPSNTGTIRLSNSNTIYSNNAAGSADIHLIQLNASDNVILGDSSRANISLESGTFTVYNVADQMISADNSGVYFRTTGGTYRAAVLSDEIDIVVPLLSFRETVASPALRQDDITTASATGQTMIVQSQNATGATSTGGGLTLRSGDGTSADGDLTIVKGTTMGVLSTSTTEVTLGGDVGGTANPLIINLISGTGIDFQVGGGTSLHINNTSINPHKSIFFDSGVVGPTINQAIDTTNSSTGDTLTIHSQICVGTNSTGGNLVLYPGSGSMADGLVIIQDANNNDKISVSENVNINSDSLTTIGVNGTRISLTETIMELLVPLVQFSSTMVNPAIIQEEESVSTSSQSFTIKAQDNSTSTGSGGFLELSAGDGTHGGGNSLGGNALLRGGNGSLGNGNISFHSNASNFQSGQRVIFIAESSNPPTGNPSNGGFLFIENGDLKYRGPSGTTTVIASS